MTVVAQVDISILDKTKLGQIFAEKGIQSLHIWPGGGQNMAKLALRNLFTGPKQL